MPMILLEFNYISEAMEGLLIRNHIFICKCISFSHVVVLSLFSLKKCCFLSMCSCVHTHMYVCMHAWMYDLEVDNPQNKYISLNELIHIIRLVYLDHFVSLKILILLGFFETEFCYKLFFFKNLYFSV